jgi:hypothetical protein
MGKRDIAARSRAIQFKQQFGLVWCNGFIWYQIDLDIYFHSIKVVSFVLKTVRILGVY